MSRLVIVTGSSQGLGRALALRALARGSEVVGLARSEASIVAGGYSHHQVDLRDQAATSDVMARIVERAGDRPAVLVNNAGLYTKTPLAGLTTSDLADALAANLFTATNATLSFIHGFQRGHIVFICGLSAVNPSSASGAYGTAKAAIARFAASLDKELDPKCYTITTLYAGTINTWSAEHVDDTIASGDAANWILDQCLSDESSLHVREAVLRPALAR